MSFIGHIKYNLHRGSLHRKRIVESNIGLKKGAEQHIDLYNILNNKCAKNIIS